MTPIGGASPLRMSRSVSDELTIGGESVDGSRHPRHVVTAVLVAHDGARWLPRTLDALAAQWDQRPPVGMEEDLALGLAGQSGAPRAPTVHPQPTTVRGGATA